MSWNEASNKRAKRKYVYSKTIIIIIITVNNEQNENTKDQCACARTKHTMDTTRNIKKKRKSNPISGEAQKKRHDIN